MYLIDRTELAGAQFVADVPQVALLAGKKKFARLGWALATGDPTGDGEPDLLVTQPRIDSGNGRVSGQAHLFAGGAGFAEGFTVPSAADWSINGPVEFGMLGQSIRLADLNNDGRDDVIVALSRDRRRARTAGSVLVFFAEDPQPQTLTPDEIEPGEQITCELSGEALVGEGLQVEIARQGEALVVSEVDVVDATTLSFTVTAAADVSIGDYDLTVTTVFGTGELLAAMTVTEPVDDDTVDDDTVDDDTADDDTADDDTADDDAADDDTFDDDTIDDDTIDDDVADDDDDDGGCGC